MILDPLALTPENEYNLNVVQEFTVTDYFHTMDREVIECQDEETFDDCVTKNMVDDIQDNCNCLPLNIRISNEVFKILLKLLCTNCFIQFPDFSL